MTSPELREFTAAEIDGSKNAMGYPELRERDGKLEPIPFIKIDVSTHVIEAPKVNPPRKRSK